MKLQLLLALTLSSTAFAQVTGTVQLQANKDEILCLTAQSNTDGSPVYIAQCTLDKANRSWTITKGSGTTSTITIFGNKCLDVTGGRNADGTKLQIFTCGTGNKNQQWEFDDSDQTIHWAGTNKCVDNTNGVTKNGNLAQVFTCGAGNTNQKWNPASVSGAPAVPPLGVVTFFDVEAAKHENGCITAASNTNGAPVVLDVCEGGPGSGSALQNWVVTAGSSVSGKGPVGVLNLFNTDKCLDVVNGNTANGAKLQLFQCTQNNKNQMFRVNGDLTIEWAGRGGGKCVDLTGGNQTDGNQLQSWDCTKFNANQQWNVETGGN